MNPVSSIAEQVSSNFAVAKIMAIFLVVSGHFFDGSLLWVPVTVGLFVFAYSSAYFTAKKYGCSFCQKSFWSSKIGRLVLPFWLIQVFLLLLFLVTGREGILTWQTLIHWMGQSGWLNWFGVDNASPFGAGLWFFTLLLIFYLLYPFLSSWNSYPLRAHASLPIALAIALLLDQQVKVGHALWITAFAFWFGAYAARYPLRGSAWVWLLISIGAAVLMLAVNMFDMKSFNIYLLVALSVATVQWIERATIPKKWFSWLLWLGPCVLEIYLIHTYLFISSDQPVVMRFVTSMALIIVVAMVLARISNYLTKRIFKTS